MSKHQEDTLISIIAGAVGGVAKLYTPKVHLIFLKIDWAIPERLIEAGIAALACGFLGALGKHLFTYAMKTFYTRKNKR